ncbi:MAG: homoserine O-acetyltransferase, partial [Pseudomonadota bacterium]
MPNTNKFIELPSPFRMRRGGELLDARIVYETWGELNSDKSNAILIFTGLSPSAHATSSAEDVSPGWWEDMVGPGRPIDTERYFVICANSLGSCFGSTGAASINPETGKRYGLDFPVLTLEDIATATHQVVLALGIEQLYAVCGSSMGGMTTLSYAILFPEFAPRLVSISSAARSLPLAIALRSLQREAIRKDPAWKDGEYDPNEPPMQGMYMARKIGMITYRSAKEWNKRFARERIPGVTVPGHLGLQFEVESYLEAHAKKFTGGFD